MNENHKVLSLALKGLYVSANGANPLVEEFYTEALLALANMKKESPSVTTNPLAEAEFLKDCELFAARNAAEGLLPMRLAQKNEPAWRGLRFPWGSPDTKIKHIKELREAFGCGLKEAKFAYEMSLATPTRSYALIELNPDWQGSWLAGGEIVNLVAGDRVINLSTVPWD